MLTYEQLDEKQKAYHDALPVKMRAGYLETIPAPKIVISRKTARIYNLLKQRDLLTAAVEAMNERLELLNAVTSGKEDVEELSADEYSKVKDAPVFTFEDEEFTIGRKKHRTPKDSEETQERVAA